MKLRPSMKTFISGRENVQLNNLNTDVILKMNKIFFIV